MLKKFGLTALALIMSMGVLSIGEAAQNDPQDNYCRRGGYCCNQGRNLSDNNDDGWGCGEYCNAQRGCW